MEKVKITFADKSEIEAEKNGSSYITDSKPAFPSDLSTVKITGENTNESFTSPRIVKCASIDGRYWFSFVEVSETARAVSEMKSNIDYIAMMSNISLKEA